MLSVRENSTSRACARHSRRVPVPQQSFINVKIENGGQTGVPKSVLDKIPVGKTLNWNDGLSTEFISEDRLTNARSRRTGNQTAVGMASSPAYSEITR